MGKRDLKKQYPELEYNFIDLITVLDTTPTKKVTPFLVRQFNDWIRYRPDELSESSPSFEKMSKLLGRPKNEMDEIIKKMVFQWAQPKLEIIEEFTEHMESNRLNENDINKYDNWSAIKLAINEAEIKQGVKNKKNKIIILHQDEEWLILKPLSIEASINYGYGTKWCTSMKNSNSYFHRYSKEGVLIFVINRKNGVKYAIYSSPSEFSVWTATDARIDSMETTIPFNLMMKMKSWTNFDEVGPNYNYFEDEDKDNDDRVKSASDALRNVFSRQVQEQEITGISIEESFILDSVDYSGGHELDDTVIEDEQYTPEPECEPTFDSSYSIEAEEYLELEDGPTEEYLELNEGENMDVYVDIEGQDDYMVGMASTIHGLITEQNERTWKNPYPNYEVENVVEDHITDSYINFDINHSRLTETFDRVEEEPQAVDYDIDGEPGQQDQGSYGN